MGEARWWGSLFSVSSLGTRYKNYKDQIPMLIDSTKTRISSDMIPEGDAVAKIGGLTIAVDSKLSAK